MYQENDYVIHRSNGLCRVIGTGYPEFGGMKGSSICYILENQRSKGKLYTPMEGCDKILRPVMDRQQAEELVSTRSGWIKPVTESPYFGSCASMVCPPVMIAPASYAFS